MDNFSLISPRNIHGYFFRLKFAFLPLQFMKQQGATLTIATADHLSQIKLLRGTPSGPPPCYGPMLVMVCVSDFEINVFILG